MMSQYINLQKHMWLPIKISDKYANIHTLTLPSLPSEAILSAIVSKSTVLVPLKCWHLFSTHIRKIHTQVISFKKISATNLSLPWILNCFVISKPLTSIFHSVQHNKLLSLIYICRKHLTFLWKVCFLLRKACEWLLLCRKGSYFFLKTQMQLSLSDSGAISYLFCFF
jgi:hypothetical protein